MIGSDPTLSRERPWPGLRQFAEAEHQFFHGRSREIEELAAFVQRAPACLVYGESGVGKSSLIQAGLFPVLRRLDYLPIHLSIKYDSREASPSDQIRTALAAAMTSSRVTAPALDAAETLWEYFHRRDVTFWGWGNRVVRPVFVFDQFEEAFTHGQETPAAARRVRELEDELESMIEQTVPASVRRRFEDSPETTRAFDFDRQPLKVVVVLREDFFPQLDASRAWLPSLLGNRYRLAGMTPGQALDAILEPGVHLVTPQVAGEIVDFVTTSERERRHPTEGAGAEPKDAEGPGGAVVEPALLSLVCQQLNERRLGLPGPPQTISSELVRNVGTDILDNYYEEAFAGLVPDVRLWVEKALLTPSGYRDRAVIERATLSGVAEAALHELVKRRLLHSEKRRGDTWVELSHDLLTGPARRSRARSEQLAVTEERRRIEDQVIRSLRAELVNPSADPSAAAEAALARLPSLASSSVLCSQLAAEICVEAGDFAKATRHLTTTEPRVTDAALRAHRSYLHGSITFETGSFARAREHFLLAIDLAQGQAELDEEAWRADVLSRLRLAHLSRRQLDPSAARDWTDTVPARLDAPSAVVARDEVELRRLETLLERTAIHHSVGAWKSVSDTLDEVSGELRAQLDANRVNCRWAIAEATMEFYRGDLAWKQQQLADACSRYEKSRAQAAAHFAKARGLAPAVLLVRSCERLVSVTSNGIREKENNSGKAGQSSTGSPFTGKAINWAGEALPRREQATQAAALIALLDAGEAWSSTLRLCLAFLDSALASLAEEEKHEDEHRLRRELAITRLKSLTAREPDVAGFRCELAEALADRALCETSPNEKLVQLALAVAELEHLPASVMTSPSVLRVRSYVRRFEASEYRRLGQADLAVRGLEDAISVTRALVQASADLFNLEVLSGLLEELADERDVRSGNLELAAEQFQAAIKALDTGLNGGSLRVSDRRRLLVSKARLERRCAELWAASVTPGRGVPFLQRAGQACLEAWEIQPWAKEPKEQLQATLALCLRLGRIFPSEEIETTSQSLNRVMQFMPASFAVKPAVPGTWRLVTGEDTGHLTALLGRPAGSVNKVRALPLSFYGGLSLIEVEFTSERGPMVAAFVRLATEWMPLDGSSPNIHHLNEAVPLRIDTADLAAAYLRFFVNYIQGDQGRFEIVEHVDQLTWEPGTPAAPRAEIAARISPVVLYPGPEGAWTATATVRYGDALFWAAFSIPSNGAIVMSSDDSQLGFDLPIAVEYFANGARSRIPGDAVRAEALVAAALHRWTDAARLWGEWVEHRRRAVDDGYAAMGADELRGAYLHLTVYRCASGDFSGALESADQGIAALNDQKLDSDRLVVGKVVSLACLDRRREAEEILRDHVKTAKDPRSRHREIANAVEQLRELGIAQEALTWLHQLLLAQTQDPILSSST